MSFYKDAIAAIQKSGAAVLSEVFVNDAIKYGGSPLPVEQIYKRDIGMIQEADVVIAEVTNPSLGVGYELAYAEKLGKPILCLYNQTAAHKLSAMIAGNPYNTVVTYDSSESLAHGITSFLG